MKHIYNQESFGEDWFDYAELYKSFVNSLEDGSSIVEVGSWKGKSAAYLAVEILNSKKNIKLYCVDTWMGSSEHKGHHLVMQDKLYQLFMDNIKPLLKVIKPIRKESVDASSMFENNSLDAVFIDAEHSYDAVKQDIAAWYPKVKNGGILAGHDYVNYYPGVIRAVDEMFPSGVSTEYRSCWVHEVKKKEKKKDSKKEKKK